jgi:hypothetical protein
MRYLRPNLDSANEFGQMIRFFDNVVQWLDGGNFFGCVEKTKTADRRSHHFICPGD